MSKSILGRLALLLATLCWGSSFVVLKNTLNDISTMWLLAIRFTIASTLFFIVSRGQLKRVDKMTLRGGILMGCSLTLGYIFQTFGLMYTTPAKNAFLTAVNCVLVPFMAYWLYRRPLTVQKIIGGIVCFFGIALVSLENGFDAVNIGDILTLLCGIFYGLQVVITERYARADNTGAINAIQFLVVAGLSWVGALAFEQPPEHISLPVWGNIAYFSIMCTGVAYFLLSWGVRYTPSSTAALILTFEAVFGTLFSVFLYGERLTPAVLCGFALIFFAILGSELDFSKRKAARAEGE